MFAKDRNNEEKRYWYCSIDGEYMRKMIRSFLVLGGVVLAAAMVYMLVTPVTPSELIYFFIGFGAVMLIILAVCGLVWLTRNRFPVPYTMTEDYICYGSGKSERHVYFKDVFSAEEESGKIRLRTRFTRHLIYIPDAGYNEIRDFILARVEENGKFR